MGNSFDTNPLQPLAGYPHAQTALGLAALLLGAWVANWLTRQVLLRVVARLAQALPTHWDVVSALARLGDGAHASADNAGSPPESPAPA